MSTIDTETLNADAYANLFEHDSRMVGTPAYLGIAYFWNYAYRYPMRDVSYSCRRRVHAAMLDAGLPLDEASETHRRLIEDTMNATDRKHLADCYGRAWVTPGLSVDGPGPDTGVRMVTTATARLLPIAEWAATIQCLEPNEEGETVCGGTCATCLARAATEGAPR